MTEPNDHWWTRTCAYSHSHLVHWMVPTVIHICLPIGQLFKT